MKTARETGLVMLLVIRMAMAIERISARNPMPTRMFLVFS
jgi:hypothetical protein